MIVSTLLTALAIVYLVLLFFRPTVNRWGATDDEIKMNPLGSDTLKNKKILSTHAVTIDAPPQHVWKYVVQVGQNRGGFYSYRWLENLVGCKMPAVETIVPDLQNLKLGDEVFLHPKQPPLIVRELIADRLLALEGWYLIVQPAKNNSTRLIARGYDWRDPNKAPTLVERVCSGLFFDWAHFIMERKMLLNIKRLSERLAEREQLSSLQAISEN